MSNFIPLGEDNTNENNESLKNISLDTAAPKEKALSVTQLNLQAKTLLERNIGTIIVEGEISNFAAPKSGHWYFSLKDKNSQIRCAMFRGNNLSVNFQPENGTLVQVNADVTIYTERGEFQLKVNSMSLAGEGLLQQKYDQLVKKLSNEGLFNEEFKKLIPPLPKKIGIITSPHAAALFDVLNVLKRRFPAIPIVLYPTQVQGQTAHHEIVKAINTACAHNTCDVLILTRGGGSLEDLWSFNEEEVARAIFKAHIPIICGVGHEIDITIADFVSDKRAPTPSAAAELATPEQLTLLSNVVSAKEYLVNVISQKIANFYEKVKWLKKRIRDPESQIKNNLIFINNIKNRINQSINKTIEIYKTNLKFSKKNLAQSIKRNFEIQVSNFGFLAKKLHTVSPLATLDRGYSIVEVKIDNNDNIKKIIKDSKDVKVGDKLLISFSKGKANCTVDEIEV